MRTVTLIAASVVSAGLLLAGCSGQSTDARQALSATTAAPAAAEASQAVRANGPSLAPDNGDGARRLANDYKQRCGKGQRFTEDCEILRALLVAEVSTDLELMATSKDQRMVPRALAALDLPDAPGIMIAALRILAQFPETPGLVDKVMPQLSNRSIDVQRAAAGLLASTTDVGAVEAGQLWLHNHEELKSAGAYDEYPYFPAQFRSMGFPRYPNLEWFSPGDSDRAVGFSTKDDAAAVTRWFAQALKAEPMDVDKWSEQTSEQSTMAMQSTDLSATIQRMQSLAERAVAGDKAAAAELEKVRQDMDKAGDASGQAVSNAVGQVRPPDSAIRQAKWFVARTKGKRFSTIVIVYPLPRLKRTVIQTVWDLSDYPSAWPAPPAPVAP